MGERGFNSIFGAYSYDSYATNILTMEGNYVEIKGKTEADNKYDTKISNVRNIAGAFFDAEFHDSGRLAYNNRVEINWDPKLDPTKLPEGSSAAGRVTIDGVKKIAGVMMSYGPDSIEETEAPSLENNEVKINNASIKAFPNQPVSIIGAEVISDGYSLKNNSVKIVNSDIPANTTIAGGKDKWGYKDSEHPRVITDNTVVIGRNITSNQNTLQLKGLYGGLFTFDINNPENDNYMYFHEKTSSWKGNTLRASSKIQTEYMRGFQNYDFTLYDGMDLSEPYITVTNSTLAVPLFYKKDASDNAQVSITNADSTLKQGTPLVLIDSAAGFIQTAVVQQYNEYDEDLEYWKPGLANELRAPVTINTAMNVVRYVSTQLAPNDYQLEFKGGTADKATQLVLTLSKDLTPVPDPQPDPDPKPDPDPNPNPDPNPEPNPNPNPGTIPSVVNPETHALMQSSLAGYSTLFASSDFFVDTVMHSARASHEGLFAAGRAGRYGISTDTRVTSNVVSGLLGVGHQMGSTEIGGYIEIGHASYETKTPLASGTVKNKGRNNYAGVGLYAFQKVGDTGLNVTGYLKTGVLRNDFDVALLSQPMNFDKESLYWGAHLGVNYQFDLGEKFSNRVFLNYFYDGQKGQTYDIGSGANAVSVHYDALNGQRVQLGTRLEYRYAQGLNPFVGLAAEQVIAAKADGKARDALGDLRLVSDDAEGTTGILTMGWSYLNETGSFELTTAVNGYFGAREGLNGELTALWKF